MKSGPRGRPWNPYGRLELGSWTWSPFHSGSLLGTGKSPHPGSQWPAGGESHWGGLEPHYPRDLPGETGSSKLLSGLCSGDRREGPKQCKPFGKRLMRQGGGWAGYNRRPAYQFPFQLLGWFLGSTLTIQHQWLPDLGCEVSTAYCCPWKTAPRWRSRKGDGADKTSTGCVRESEKWYPGSRKVLGRFREGAECFRKGR